VAAQNRARLGALGSETSDQGLIKEASAKLKESSALYLLFMEEARKYMALDPPED
jgi:hypothetical protein